MKEYIASYKQRKNKFLKLSPYIKEDKSCDLKEYREIYTQQENEEPYYGEAKVVVNIVEK